MCLFFLRIKELVDRYKKLINKISKDLMPLLKPHRENVDNAMKAGLISVTWASTNIDECKTRI